MSLFRWINKLLVLVSLLLLTVPLAHAQDPFDDLTPNEHTFVGRRGTSYTATWNPYTYNVTISTPNGTFPWDWTAFVNANGAIALAGHPNVAQTFRFSDAGSLAGLGSGDIMRVKAWDIINLAHLTKIGLVIGSGPSAQRAWFSQGTITHYFLAPHFIGYQASVLGRTVTVRLSHLAPATLEAVGVIQVELDDPTDAYLIVASDLEPRTQYQQAVEYRNSNDTVLSFQTPGQTIRGVSSDGTSVFFYTSEPMASWSAHNLPLDDYLAMDVLDQTVQAGQGDGRAALKVVAQPVQYFYIGNVVLNSPAREAPASLINTLHADRLAALRQLPLIDTPDLPAFKFVMMVSNLFGSYLLNPAGRLYYTDKAFPYTADGLASINGAAELLPDAWLEANRDYLALIGQLRYQSPSQGVYWWRANASGNLPLPAWYGPNIPDIFFRNRNNSVSHRFQYSDVYSTALYLIGLHNYYQVTGDQAFVESQEAVIRDTVSALQTFDTAYGADSNLFPHLIMPMGDMASLEGIYPAESGYTVYAYEDAARLFQVLGDDAAAANLLDNYVTPMRASYDTTFWNNSAGYFFPLRDNRSQSGSGTYFHDYWSHALLVPLRGDLGNNRLPNLLTTVTKPQFYDADNNYRWLSSDSENYRPDNYFSTGYVMHGGFFNGVPNALPAATSYQLGQNSQADDYANDFYLDVWTRMGPYETMRQWDTTPAGMYLETSIYIEALAGTWWLFKEAAGLQVDGATVTIEPRVEGEFVIRNVRVTANGLSALFDYARDEQGQEHLRIINNDGLTIVAPNIDDIATATATPVDTATATPVDTATATPVDTATATPVDTATATPVDTATATPVDTATATATATPTATLTVTSEPTPAVVPTAPGHRTYIPIIIK